jgi:hypothetical protein
VIIRWGRLDRGRVWHLLDAAGATFCDDGTLAVEVNQGLPPEGGRPCPRCAHLAADLAGSAGAAKLHASWSRSPEEPPELLTPDPYQD